MRLQLLLTRHRAVRWAILGVAAVTSLAVAAPASASAHHGSHGKVVYRVHPHMKLYKTGTKLGALPTPSECVQSSGLACYTPDLIRKAYNVPDDWTGAGQTIVIVDAYGSPTIKQDLAVFDAAFGLPAPPSFHIYCPSGCPKTQHAHKGQPQGWAGETSLDVEWSHAIAPDANIALVVAGNNFGNSINVATRFAVSHHLGNIMSMSYGADEAGISGHGHGNNLQIHQAHQVFQQAVNQGMSLFASAGDAGASNGSPGPGTGYPASDPLVTSVGGTNLFMTDNGTYEGETVWNDSDPNLCPFGCTAGVFGATGGAPSVVWPTPSYQQGVTGQSTRAVSDVSYNASVYTAVLVYAGYFPGTSQDGFYFFGGTSAGSPQWAGIAALADAQAGQPLGQLNPLLYSIAASGSYSADFHDVTVGNNALGGPGFDAATGYDMPTGLGSPNVEPLVTDLVQMTSP